MDTPPEERFKTNLLSLFDIINDMFKEGVDNGVIQNSINILPLVKLHIKKKNSEELINDFIHKTEEFWEIIKRKNDGYIKEKMLDIFNDVKEKGVGEVKTTITEKNNTGTSDIVNSLSGDRFTIFKDLLSKSYTFEGKEYYILDEERKEEIWSFMHSFVKISLCHFHQTRKMIDGKYSVDFFNNINVKELASDWKVKKLMF